ncbi:MAG: ribose 5-phosphate isomerase B [Vallitalea sp.]|jgi:ribose 5-phosphate isomerase B|nr:ribose 5-phosphate isomerase B [Vallitalea sp.]
MKLVVGCDNAAVELKDAIKEYLVETRSIEFIDVGVVDSNDGTHYPNIVKQAVALIKDKESEVQHGILICGTGIGMALTANKFKGIRAAVCHDVYSAERAKLSNNANVLTMGARVIATELAKKIVDVWLDNEYIGGRSVPKVNLINEIEDENFIG